MKRGSSLLGMGALWCMVMAFVLLVWSGPLAAVEEKSQEAGSPSPGQSEGVKLSYQDYTNLIAGNKMDAASLEKYVNPEGWLEYAEGMNQIWQRFDQKHLKSMRAWAAQELGPAQTVEGTVFYPFSGPDVVNMLAFFPKAQNYLLIALEPVGTLPVLQPGKNEPFYYGLEQSLSELLQYNFFFTKRMEKNLVKRELDGVLPVLLYFLGRENVQILNINYWQMQPDGSIVETPVKGGEKLNGGGIPGVKIVFQRQEGEPEQTLYYFRFNLQDSSWRSNPQFVKFLKGFAPFRSFVKAASYLMFKPYFSDVRQFILNQSQLVLQTDEGVPLRYFEPERWDRRFYGKYSCPIQLFANCFQADMAGAYHQGPCAKPLPFAIGYHHNLHSSNLMLASRKAIVAEEGAK